MKNFFLIILCFLAFNARANNSWIYAAANDSLTIWVDNNSIQKSGDSITFWTRTNFKARVYGDLSSKNQLTINCRTREVIMRHLIFYDDINNFGKMTSNFSSIDPKWEPIPPDTINWNLLVLVCK